MAILSRTVVPIWVAVATVPLGAVLQFAMIKSKKIPRWLYALIPFLVTAVDPLLFETTEFRALATTSCFKLFLFLRLLDVGLLPRATVETWTAQDYGEYLVTLYTRNVQPPEKRLKGPNRPVPPENQNARYYGKLAYTVVTQYIVYHFLIFYMRHFMTNQDPEPRRFANLANPKEILDHMVFCATLCIMLSLSNS
jgi:hypothetical protein